MCGSGYAMVWKKGMREVCLECHKLPRTIQSDAPAVSAPRRRCSGDSGGPSVPGRQAGTGAWEVVAGRHGLALVGQVVHGCLPCSGGQGAWQVSAAAILLVPPVHVQRECVLVINIQALTAMKKCRQAAQQRQNSSDVQ